MVTGTSVLDVVCDSLYEIMMKSRTVSCGTLLQWVMQREGVDDDRYKDDQSQPGV